MIIMEIQGKINVILNHSTPSIEKLSSTKPVPGAKKAGNH